MASEDFSEKLKGNGIVETVAIANTSEEGVFAAASSSDDRDHELANPAPAVDAAFEKATLRKVDRWLVGFYSLVYVFRVIDSGNYSNAAIINLEQGTGIKTELGFNPSQWAWTQSIFSYSYLVFEPSNTLLLKVFRPSRWMFCLIFFWGAAACASAASQNFSGMMGARFAIGAAEAGFYPAVLYHMAFWYKPQELPSRIALFYSVGQLSGALSGLLAYAVSFMDGLQGISGWRWLFIIEGLPAIALAFVALFWLPDYPETASFLTEKQRTFLSGRIGERAPTGWAKNWDRKAVASLFRDPTFYTFSIYWIGHGIGGFGINYALPTVIYQLGFTSTTNSQLMNIPPYVATFFFLNTLGALLQRKIIRPWTTAVGIAGTIIVCYIILFTVSNSVVKYVFLIIAVSCAGSAYPVIWPERMRALEGTVSSGIGIGFTNAMAQFSGIVGPHIYSTVYGPSYHLSFGVCIIFLVVDITALLLSWYFVTRKDKRIAALCDETRPGCANCSKHGVDCDFPAVSPSHHSASVESPRQPPPSTPRPGGTGTEVARTPLAIPLVGDVYGRATTTTAAAVATDSTPASSGRILQPELVHLELLHNYSTLTSQTLSADPVLRNAWRINAPREGFRHGFVMRSIFALSALHMSQFTTSDRGRQDMYLQLARAEHGMALREIATALSEASAENCSAIYISAALIFLYAWACPRQPGDIFLVSGEVGAADWVFLLRGIRSIMEAWRDELLRGPFSPMIRKGQDRVGGTNPVMLTSPAWLVTAEHAQLVYLRRTVMQAAAGEDAQTAAAYQRSIDRLERSYCYTYYRSTNPVSTPSNGSSPADDDAIQRYGNLAAAVPGPALTSNVYYWLYCMEDGFIDLIVQRKPLALVVFAYFCVLLRFLSSCWWMQGWTTHLLQEIWDLLDEEHRLWIRWPIEELGWGPSA